MTKNILMLLSSLCKGGNAETLVDELFPKAYISGTVLEVGVDEVGTIKGNTALTTNAYEMSKTVASEKE